jgi:ribonuclease HII
VSENHCDRLELERELWREGFHRLVGIDEAGRGPIAGPVVAAALVLPSDWSSRGVPTTYLKLNDSKKLTARQRLHFHEMITTDPDLDFSVAIMPHNIIDQINILAATHLAMNQAAQGLKRGADFALVDGNPVRGLSLPHRSVIQGDSLSYSIAGASVLAKVTRDRIMTEADSLYPGYGFARHKGYPTSEHLLALRTLGPSPIHRLSFAPLQTREPDLFP